MNNVIEMANKAELMESVLIGGDLSKLTPEQRSNYYLKVCESVGLNAMTKPFEYITLNNKLVLYAKRDATDQLRSIHGVSIMELSETEREGVYIVTAKAINKDGRTDMAKGAVNIASLKGDALANAIMKTETKAKRRVTLSLCGLGLLDETELETIPASSIQEVKPDAPAYRPVDPIRPHKAEYVVPAPILPDGTLDFDEFTSELESLILKVKDSQELSLFNRSNSKTLRAMEKERPDLFKYIGELFRTTGQSLM